MRVAIIGLDGAYWKIILQNLDTLPTFKRLITKYKWGIHECTIRPIHSAAIWTSLFSGLDVSQHRHTDWTDDIHGCRQNMNYDFLWDILYRKGYNVVVLNALILFPTYSFNCSFEPVKFGCVINLKEAKRELSKLYQSTKKIFKRDRPELFVVTAYTIDPISHDCPFNGDEVKEVYRMVDCFLSQLLNLLHNYKVFILSDHGLDLPENCPEYCQSFPDGVRPTKHHPHGIFIVKGFGSGGLWLNTLDFAPTLLDLFNLPKPVELKGKSILKDIKCNIR